MSDLGLPLLLASCFLERGERDADDDDQNDVDGRAAAADPTGNTPPEREREREREREMDSEPIHSQRAVEGRRRKGSGIEEHVLLRSSENIWV